MNREMPSFTGTAGFSSSSCLNFQRAAEEGSRTLGVPELLKQQQSWKGRLRSDLELQPAAGGLFGAGWLWLPMAAATCHPPPGLCWRGWQWWGVHTALCLPSLMPGGPEARPAHWQLLWSSFGQSFQGRREGGKAGGS